MKERKKQRKKKRWNSKRMKVGEKERRKGREKGGNISVQQIAPHYKAFIYDENLVVDFLRYLPIKT